jgi:iron complex outermembrane recepter protein
MFLFKGLLALRPVALTIAMMFPIANLMAADAPDNPAEILELPTVEVIGTTPLPGIGTPVKDVPANVQVFTSKDFAKQKHTDVAEYLEQNPTSVTVNAAQGNPFQVDVNFRGFTASPLLGTPQGLSVFQDGVRINEPFGDAVNWDLIPQSAISSIQVIPGSNPVFGLNTLGGALSVYTKSGFQYPGAAIEALFGSFRRKQIGFELGGNNGKNFDYFLTGNFFDEKGWGDHNPSRVKQFFAKVGWQNDNTDFDVSLSVADNELEGMQSLPKSYIRENFKQAYTFPDINENKLTFLNAKASHFFTEEILLGGNVYFRKFENTNTSSNQSDEFDISLPIDDDDNFPALNDRSVIDQDSFGGSIQLTLDNKIGTRKNQLTVGASADLGKANFQQLEQAADWTADRSITPFPDAEFELETNADTKNAYYGLFFTDTFQLSDLWGLTLSGRYNRAQVKIVNKGDAIDDKLNGDHTFSRFNPAIGVNFNPSPKVTAYATYNEGMRAPTPMELTCADPEAPCKLPNSFLADPPLKKVVSKTIELGARGKIGEGSSWNAAIYRTDLKDDIQFISSNLTTATNLGYFQNVGDTRREGLELGGTTKFSNFTFSARYAYLKATYQSSFTVFSPFNSSADADGNIQVSSGNRIPGFPEHNIKLRLDYDWNETFSIGANVLYSAGVYARGDENNQDENGKIPGYAVFNLDGRYNFTKKFQIFARVNNLFDKRYANFGILGENLFPQSNGKVFTGGGNGETEQFQSLGSPRGIWIGARYEI